MNHGLQVTKYNCIICTTPFAQKEHLLEHMRSHPRDRPYVCNECGKAFPLRGNLMFHAKMHQKDRPFRCDLCSKDFKCKGHLVTHRRAHLKNNNLGYAFDKTFVDKSNAFMLKQLMKGETANMTAHVIHNPPPSSTGVQQQPQQQHNMIVGQSSTNQEEHPEPQLPLHTVSVGTQVGSCDARWNPNQHRPRHSSILI
ncbi:uncharacterized protein isoform X1 [Rhodnius prolixus]|uniref:C2H2-type domain-containing protein n=2 Tax=Rhodnius prolixus TaxID=13249 RepID=T1I682_RHOPR